MCFPKGIFLDITTVYVWIREFSQSWLIDWSYNINWVLFVVYWLGIRICLSCMLYLFKLTNYIQVPCEGNKCLHLCRNIHVYSCCLSTSAYKTFCDVMEMKEVKIAGVQHWHLSTELWTGSWTNNQEKQVSFDGQSCQHRLLVKRVNKERDRERGNDIFKLCRETDFNLLVLWLLSTAVLWAERRGDRSGAGVVHHIIL